MPELYESVAVGGVMTMNRVVMAPMTNKQSNLDGQLSEAEIEWLARRAQGGFGMIVTGGYAVAPEGRVWRGQASVYSEDHGAPLVNLADRLKGTSALGIVQLIHGGSRYSADIAKTQGISASAGASWREATADDIEGLIEAHRVAATRVEQAGLAGVEIHAAHGYLPAQFISRTGNQRTDQWGGDLSGRSRFLRELVRAIRASVAPGFVIGVRLSAEDRRHGIELEETSLVGAMLAEDGMDYLHVSLRNALEESESENRHPLALIRGRLPNALPIAAAGGIRTALQAQELLNCGADLVALGEVAIFNPEWPRLARVEGWTPRTPPFTVDEFAAVAVTPPFTDYLAEGWPYFVQTSSEANPRMRN